MAESYLERVKWKRSDLSFFLVHLTKDNPQTGKTARDSLEAILTPRADGRCLLEGTTQGFFDKVGIVPKELVTSVSFTEAPLDQIKHFAKPLKGGGRKYSQFGLVFEQEVIRDVGGNPCFYVNTKSSNELKEAMLALIDVEAIRSNPRPEYLKLLPFFNIFGKAGGDAGKEVDFYWEREWRVPHGLPFNHEHVFVGLSEAESIDYLSEKFPIPFICPDWNYDRILRQLRSWRRS